MSSTAPATKYTPNAAPADESDPVSIQTSTTHVDASNVTNSLKRTTSQPSKPTDTYEGPSASSSTQQADAEATRKADAEADAKVQDGGKKLADGITNASAEAKDKVADAAPKIGDDFKKLGQDLGAAAKGVYRAAANNADSIESGIATAATGLGHKAKRAAHSASLAAIQQPAHNAANRVAAARTSVWVARPNEIGSSKVPLAIFLGSAVGLAAYALTSAAVATVALTLPAILGSLMVGSAVFLAGRYINRAFFAAPAPTDVEMGKVSQPSRGIDAMNSDYDNENMAAVAVHDANIEQLQARYIAVNEERAWLAHEITKETLERETRKNITIFVPKHVAPELAKTAPPAQVVVEMQKATVEIAQAVVVKEQTTHLVDAETDGAISDREESEYQDDNTPVTDAL